MMFHDVDALARRYQLPRERVKDAIEDEYRRVQLRSPLAWVLLAGALLALGVAVFGLREGPGWAPAAIGLCVAWLLLGFVRSRRPLHARLAHEGARA